MKKTVKTFVASVYQEPAFHSQLVTQALLWEQVEILDEKESWYRIRQWDNYEGWLNSFYLSDKISEKRSVSGFYITERFIPVWSEPSCQSENIGMISIGSWIPDSCLTDEQDEFYKLSFPGSDCGWITKPEFFPEKSRRSIITIAKKMLGVPYLWGGKSGYGFDCSGFVQTVFLLNSIELPRDSADQQDYPVLENISSEEAIAADLIFFHEEQRISHVGIFLNNEEILHCSGEVKINSLDPASELYSEYLSKNIHSVKSIRKLIN